MTDAMLKTIPIGKLRKNPFNPRRTFDRSEDDDGGFTLKQMAESIKKNGVLQPIIVRAWNGSYQVAAGERRRMAAELAGVREIPALVKDLDDAMMRRYALLENLHRLDLSEDEFVEAIGKIWEEDYGASQEKGTQRLMWEDLGISQQRISDALNLHMEKNPSLRHADIPSLLTKSQLISLAKEAPHAAKELVKAAKEGDLGHRELREAIPIVRAAAQKGREKEVLGELKRAARTKQRARRDMAQTMRESERYVKEGPRQEWRKVLNEDERLLNRTADLLATVEKLDATYLNLFTTPDARRGAIQVLRKARDMIDATLAKAQKMEERWKKEWLEHRSELKGG